MTSKERTGAVATIPREVRRATAGASSLRKIVTEQGAMFVELEERQKLQHKEIMSIFGFLGDTETRLEAFRAIGVRKGLFTDAEYEQLWDEIKGLRIKSPDELLEAGDSLRVTYEIKEGDTVLAEDKSFPVRLGTNSFLFEAEIIGKPCGLKDYKFSKAYPTPFPNNPTMAGKTVHFTLTVDKVKTKIKRQP